MTSVDGVIRIANKALPKLPKHLITRVGDMYKCTVCSALFKRRQIALVHHRRAHLKLNRYKCEFCNLKNHQRHPLVTHVKKVHPEKLQSSSDENPVPFLPKRISRPKQKLDPSTLPELKVLEVKTEPNIQEHIIVDGCRYGCKFCGKYFIQRQQILDHLERVHFGVRNFQCKVCEKKFFKISHGKRHIRNCKLLGKTECPNSIQYPMDDLEAEIKSPPPVIKEVDEDPLINGDVKFQADEETSVEIPMHEQLNIKVLPFSFDFDDPNVPKSLDGGGNAENSIQSTQHRSENRISKVTNQFSTAQSEEVEEGSDNRKGAAKTRDPIFDVIQPGDVIELPKDKNYKKDLNDGCKRTPKGYECQKCGKLSRRRTIFIQHWGSIHATSGGYGCSICQKRFYFRFKCAQHFITKHTNLNPYTCKICGRKVTSSPQLKRHVKLHLDERGFSCSSCTLKFTSEKGLQRHIENTHMKILGT